MRTSAGLANSSRVMLGIAASYGIDVALLFGFAATGAIAYTIPCGYLAAGLTECLLFDQWTTRLPPSRKARNVDRIVLTRMSVCVVIQIAFLAIAPQVGLYFLGVLVIVLGLGSMSIPATRAAIVWLAIAVASGWLLLHRQTADMIPHDSAAQRTLASLCFAALLARCGLMGIFARTLHLRLEDRGERLGAAVEALKRRDDDQARVNAELMHRATHDALTGLPNRALFVDRLRVAIGEGQPFAVAVLNLDRFRHINDSLGYGAGDTALKVMARRLMSRTRARDTIARTGGDQFLLLIRDVSSGHDEERLAAQCLETVSEETRIHDVRMRLSGSMGISHFPGDAPDPEALLAHAEEALHHAKQNGGNALRLYDRQRMGLMQERLQIENDLRQALQSNQFQLWYQPKVDIAGDTMRSVEALLRWQHPLRGRLAPEAFLDVAEDSDLIQAIGAWTLAEACRQASLWKAQGLPHLRIAVNVSARHFRHPQFLVQIQESLSRHALHPSYLEIELTEAAVMASTATSAPALEQLSRLGVIVSMDDFGTGFSNMSCLQRLPLDKVKIDRSFIHRIDHNTDDASIVRAIISLAHGLRLKVCAEGVESAAQLALLRRMGCDQYQGFYRSRAVPAADIELMVAAERAQAANDALAEPAVSRLARLVQQRS